MATTGIIDGRIWYSSIPTVTVRFTMHRIAQLHRRVPRGALVMLERSAGKLARSVLRGLGEREPTWLPGGFSGEAQDPRNSVRSERPSRRKKVISWRGT